MTKIALHGATGRMGKAIARLCAERPGIELVGAICHPDDPQVGADLGEIAGMPNIGVAVTPDVDAGLRGAEVVIDFSLPPALKPLLRAAMAQGVAVVSGTTGFTAVEEALLQSASERIALLHARNMSLGVHVLAELVEQAARRLADFDVEIVEIHHNRKVDSPSGTAKRLADAVRDARPEAVNTFVRAGDVGARPRNEVGVFGVRGGDVPGDHTVFLFGPGERLELTHRAGSRDIFASGALRAASWISGKAPGLYSIADVLRG
ncbi:MAG: High confidence in function and specificity [Pseudomonadota bacterium]|jgi:4-hydroxy-tetrahydrodipicolinate reductase